MNKLLLFAAGYYTYHATVIIHDYFIAPRTGMNYSELLAAGFDTWRGILHRTALDLSGTDKAAA